MNSHAPSRLHHSRPLSEKAEPNTPRCRMRISEKTETSSGGPHASASHHLPGRVLKKSNNLATAHSKPAPSTPGTIAAASTVPILLRAAYIPATTSKIAVQAATPPQAIHETG